MAHRPERIAALLLGLIVAAILVAAWQLRFAIDAQELYDRLYQEASVEEEAGTLGWLASAGYSYTAGAEPKAGAVRTRVSAVVRRLRGQRFG